MSQFDPPKQTAPYSRSGVLAILAGAALGVYAGLAILLPLGIAWSVYAVLKKRVSGARELVLLAFALQAGHLGWFTIGVIATGQLGWNVVDLVLFGGALAWLLVAPARAPLVALAVLHAVALVMNAVTATQVSWGTAQHKALAAHIALRVAALILNVMAFRSFKHSLRNSVPLLPAPPD